MTNISLQDEHGNIHACFAAEGKTKEFDMGTCNISTDWTGEDVYVAISFAEESTTSKFYNTDVTALYSIEEAEMFLLSLQHIINEAKSLKKLHENDKK